MTETIKGYCVRCKIKKQMKNVRQAVLKNRVSAYKGTCETCGTGMVKIIGK